MSRYVSVVLSSTSRQGALLGGGKEGREAHIRVGACHDVHAVVPDELLLHAFGHAAYHADYEAASLCGVRRRGACRRLTIFCSALSRIEQVLSSTASASSILSEIVYPAILHDCGHDFAIGHVHLAAI